MEHGGIGDWHGGGLLQATEIPPHDGYKADAGGMAGQKCSSQLLDSSITFLLQQICFAS